MPAFGSSQPALAKPATPLPSQAPAGSPLQVPGLKLFAVFPGDKGQGGMAIINDLPVMEGTFLEEGILLEKILSDRVRISVRGQQFEIPITP